MAASLVASPSSRQLLAWVTDPGTGSGRGGAAGPAPGGPVQGAAVHVYLVRHRVRRRPLPLDCTAPVAGGHRRGALSRVF